MSNFLMAGSATTLRPTTIVNCHLLDRGSRDGRDPGRRDALIDDRIIVPANNVVHHGGVVENLARLMVRHAVAIIAAMVKIVEGHKRETIPRQAERKTRAARIAKIGEAHARRVTRRRRQRCPAAIRIRRAPAHPRRSPFRSRHPAPAPTRMRIPTTIVKRCPAPRIIRIPIPAAIGPLPATAMAIRTPAGRGHHHGRPPATAIALHVHPSAVGRERIIEIVYGFRCRGFCCRWRRHSGRGGWLRGGRRLARGLLPGIRGRCRLFRSPDRWGWR